MLQKNLVTTVLFLGLGLRHTFAQDAIVAAGGSAAGTGGTASYSFGQVFYSVHSQPAGIVNEGVQQPFEISAVSGMYESGDLSPEYEAFPNPVTDLLVLKVGHSDSRYLLYRLSDSNGRLLRCEHITCDECLVPM